jgi:hypothetical protein
MRNLNNSGFKVVLFSLVIVVVGMAIGAAWWVWNRNAYQDDGTESDSTFSNQSTSTANETPESARYSAHGVEIVFEDEAQFSDELQSEILEKIAKPYAFYEAPGSDLKTIAISVNYGPDGSKEDYSLSAAYESVPDSGTGFVFGGEDKIGYWQPQLCDPGGCIPYPEDLKNSYPKTYQAFVQCEEAREQNDKERASELSCM